MPSIVKLAGYCLLGFIFALPLLAQAPPPCQKLALPITVRDSSGKQIRGVVPQDFVSKVNKEKIQLGPVIQDTRPRRAVILVDTSGSMAVQTGTSRWKLAFEIAAHFSKTAAASGAQLALIRFDEQVRDVADFSPHNAQVAEVLKHVIEDETLSKKEMHGRTALYDAIDRGLRLLDHPSSADLIFAVTDGGENASHIKHGALERELLANGVRFYSVLMIDSSEAKRGRTPEELEGPKILQELSESTGGEMFGPVGYSRGGYLTFASPKYNYDPKTKVEVALAEFYQGLLQNELIQVPLMEPSEPETLEIKFSEDARHKWKDAIVAYPHKLARCEVQGEH